MMNQQIRDNGNAIWVGTTAGDMDYYTGATGKSRLGIGTAGQILKVNAGATAPEWGAGGMSLIEEKLATVPVANFDFTGIPQIYRHLKIVFAGRGDTNANFTSFSLRFNGDSGNYYNMVNFYIASDGSEANNDSGTIGGSALTIWRIPALTGIAGMVGSSEMLVFNYSGTTFFKNIHTMNLCQEDTADNIIESMWLHGMWRKTAAINQITISPAAGNFIAGSVASLYGMI
jgi:hypothetical protein